MNSVSAPAIEGGHQCGPRLSVVVPVYNRAGPLRTLLGALARQEYPRDAFEVIVCDDGSSEAIAPLVADWAGELGLSLLYLRQDNAGPGPARNLGLAHSAGPVVVFTDSDCLPEPGWLAAYDRVFRDPTIGLAGGRILFGRARHLSGRCINFVAGSSLGGAGATDPGALIHMAFYPRTLNLAVRPHLARAAGGFPRHSHGEDLEFSYRVGRGGGRTVFVGDAQVVHDERRGLAQVARENYYKGAARIRLWRDCCLHEPLHAVPSLLVIGMAALATATTLRLISPVLAAAALFPYVAALAALAIQGATAIGDLRAFVACPAYAAVIHLSYGLGYIAALLGGRSSKREREPVDWRELEETAPIFRLGTPEITANSTPWSP